MVALVFNSPSFLVICLKSTTLDFDVFGFLAIIACTSILDLVIITLRGARASRRATTLIGFHSSIS